ncbi:MAG TPA: cytochrome C, partial [Planctomycetaceae bacterium]|nr:cytochrome C [Planctomycetaceae bacterium]
MARHPAGSSRPMIAMVIGLSAFALATTLRSAEPKSTTERILPPGKLGEVVRLGREIVERTGEHPLSKPYVANSLTCQSCHLQAGQDPQAATFLKIAT